MTETQTSVYLIDDDLAVRDSLRALLKSVGIPLETFATAQEFLDHLEPANVACLILDIRMPGMSGLDLQQKLRDKGINIPIILISGHADVPMTVRAMKAGALDLLEKPFNEQVLLDRINEAIEKHSRRAEDRVELAKVTSCMGQLTKREKEVLDLMVSGKPNKVIAEELDISRKTLDIHRSKVLQKMEAESVADLVRMVLQSRSYTGTV